MTSYSPPQDRTKQLPQSSVASRRRQAAGGGQLIVSHFGLFNRDAAIADLRKFYSGPLIVGADLQCTPVQ
jgi:hypothetical protein